MSIECAAEVELDPDTPPPPPEEEILSPEWFAAFTVYWRAKTRPQRAALLEAIGKAACEESPERSIYLLQQALQSLGLAEIQIIKLILVRYIYHIRHNTEQPAPRIAEEILETLHALRSCPRKRRKTRKQP